MSFGNILGQLLEQGIAGQSRARIGTSAQNIAQGGRGFEQILGSLQSMLGGAAPGAHPGAAARPAGAAGGQGAQGSPLGGLADAAKAFLSQPQAGGMSGAHAGPGGHTAPGAHTWPGAKLAASAAPLQEDVAAVTSEESERLALRATIAAAKADGQIDQNEMDRILGHRDADDATAAERQFVLEEIRKPLDPADLAKGVRSPAQAAEVYAASLLAIDIDSETEREYLRALASALRLDPGVVSFLQRTTGAPPV